MAWEVWDQVNVLGGLASYFHHIVGAQWTAFLSIKGLYQNIYLYSQVRPPSFLENTVKSETLFHYELPDFTL